MIEVELIKQDFEEMAGTLSFVSRSRIPYTYHHDFTRAEHFNWASRGDVGQAVRGASDDQLYAGALLYLFKYHAIDMVLFYQHRAYDVYMWATSTYQIPNIVRTDEIADPPCSECGHGWGYGVMLTDRYCPINGLVCPRKTDL